MSKIKNDGLDSMAPKPSNSSNLEQPAMKGLNFACLLVRRSGVAAARRFSSTLERRVLQCYQLPRQRADADGGARALALAVGDVERPDVPPAVFLGDAQGRPCQRG